MMKILVLLLSLLLSGCCFFINNKLDFISDVLPKASVGRNYYTQIKTTGLPASDMYVNDSNILKTNGLTIIPIHTGRFWHIEIYGVPEEKGSFSFLVSGSTVGTQCPGKEFKKEFTLIITNSK